MEEAEKLFKQDFPTLLSSQKNPKKSEEKWNEKPEEKLEEEEEKSSDEEIAILPLEVKLRASQWASQTSQRQFAGQEPPPVRFKK